MSELTEKEFNEFKKRLNFHNRDREGVDRHITANPIFNVQHKKRIYGINDGYTDEFIWMKSSNSEIFYNSLDDIFKEIFEQEEDELEKVKKYCADEELEIDDLSDYVMSDIADDLGYEKCGYIKEWEHINSHLTREGAEAFILRKKHDYGEMRVWVGSQYLCWEFNEVMEGILDGKIGYIEDK